MPREEGGCKLKPQADKALALQKLKDGQKLYDEIVKASGGA